MERETKRLVHAAAFIVAALVIVTAAGPCFGQVARETWQPPEKILDAIGVKPGMRVGEAGAGRGYFTFPLARRVGPGGAVFANDISTSSLDVIRERADSEGLKNIKVVVGAVEDPLFPEKNLDMVVMVYVLHEVERQVPFLKNLRSYLKPGGSLVIIEGNTTGGSTHTPPFMTNRQVSDTLTEAGYEFDKTETFLPRDTIYIYRTPAPSGAQLGEIHDAAVAGDLDKVRALLEADPTLLESKDRDGNTPLISACFAPPSYNPQVAVANYLIDQGANIKAKNNWSGTPLYCALRSPDLIQRLIDKGADVNARAFGANGLTPLQQAASIGGLRTAKLLIDHGADLNGRSSDGTVLQNVIKRKGDANRDMVRLLLEAGAKLQEFSFGNTELHLAALTGSPDVARLLIEHGADVHAVNDYQHTALFYAGRHGYRRVADTLIALGANPQDIVEANFGKAPQLNATLQPGEAYLWFLGGIAPGTGYAVKTKGHLLVFDPYRIDDSAEAGLANGRLNPQELAGQKITFLITRSALGAPSVSELAKRFPDASIVLGFKPAGGQGDAGTLAPYRLATPHESFSLGDIQMHTVRATGRHYIEGVSGVGYLVEVDGLKIYQAGLHASSGDLAEQARYREEVGFLKPFGPVDVAILPVHGRHISIVYEPYLYLIDQLSLKAVYLIGDDFVFEEHRKCLEVLRARNVPVAYPEGGIAVGERFHYLREEASATASPSAKRRTEVNR
jgi:ankyrin repeat protein/predicted methyltransferase